MPSNVRWVRYQPHTYIYTDTERCTRSVNFENCLCNFTHSHNGNEERCQLSSEYTSIYTLTVPVLVHVCMRSYSSTSSGSGKHSTASRIQASLSRTHTFESTDTHKINHHFDCVVPSWCSYAATSKRKKRLQRKKNYIENKLREPNQLKKIKQGKPHLKRKFTKKKTKKH